MRCLDLDDAQPYPQGSCPISSGSVVFDPTPAPPSKRRWDRSPRGLMLASVRTVDSLVGEEQESLCMFVCYSGI